MGSRNLVPCNQTDQKDAQTDILVDIYEQRVMPVTQLVKNCQNIDERKSSQEESIGTLSELSESICIGGQPKAIDGIDGVGIWHNSSNMSTSVDYAPLKSTLNRIKINLQECHLLSKQLKERILKLHGIPDDLDDFDPEWPGFPSVTVVPETIDTRNITENNVENYDRLDRASVFIKQTYIESPEIREEVIRIQYKVNSYVKHPESSRLG